MFDSLPPLPFEKRSTIPTSEELLGLVEYMRKVIVDYGSGAAELGLALDEKGISRVLDALVEEVAGKPWATPGGGDVSEFFLHGLYFELSERRQSIQEKVGGKTVPISDAIWLQLIGEIRRGMRG